MIADLEAKCVCFIEEIKKYEIRGEELEAVRQDLEREKGSAVGSLERLQREWKEQSDEMSRLRNDLVLKDAHIVTL